MDKQIVVYRKFNLYDTFSMALKLGFNSIYQIFTYFYNQQPDYISDHYEAKPETEHDTEFAFIDNILITKQETDHKRKMDEQKEFQELLLGYYKQLVISHDN